MTRWTESDLAATLARSLPRQEAPPNTIKVPEADVVPAVLAALRYHPAVAWAERMNRGGMHRGGQYVNFGFDGMADITGQMKDGRRLEVECKRPFGGRVTAEQRAFIAKVRDRGGVAFFATSVDDVLAQLRAAA